MVESSKKRSDVEISVDILKVARSEVKKSHIVYQTNLNFKLLDKYLEVLTKNNLITRPCDKKTYITTEKGLKYINHYEGFQRYFNTDLT